MKCRQRPFSSLFILLARNEWFRLHFKHIKGRAFLQTYSCSGSYRTREREKKKWNAHHGHRHVTVGLLDQYPPQAPWRLGYRPLSVPKWMLRSPGRQKTLSLYVQLLREHENCPCLGCWESWVGGLIVRRNHSADIVPNGTLCITTMPVVLWGLFTAWEWHRHPASSCMMIFIQVTLIGR